MPLEASASSSPRRPPLAFRVGIVGHRPDRLQQADMPVLRGVLNDILAAVRKTATGFRVSHPGLFADAPPVLRVVSPLAEGSDRLFAEAAIALGFGLCCPMPFPNSEFEADFSNGRALEHDSLARFRGLLARAEKETTLTIFELDGSREDVGAAYGAGGRMVLNQSDLLVVIWDGQRLGKSGGTEDTFQEARRKGVPVVWIDAQAPHPWQLLESTTAWPAAPPGGRASPAAGASTDELERAVREALAPPRSQGVDSTSHRGQQARLRRSGAVTLEEFYAERKPRLSPGAALWTFFRDLVGDGKLTFARLRVHDFEQAVTKDWKEDD